MDRLPGRHVYFLDDRLFGNRRFAEALFDGMAGMTPYPGTALYDRMHAADRMLHRDWDRYDTRQVVFQPRGMTASELESGYWRAYRDFYRWSAIWRGSTTKDTARGRLRHIAYAGGWKKFEPLWDFAIRTGRVLHALPLLEAVLSAFGERRGANLTRQPRFNARSG